jgi:hypothetical protein
MFPLVHHYCNKIILPPVDNAMILGGLFPDLAMNAGIWRDTAHTCGLQFYKWCQENDHDNINFIKGILSHGTEPLGLDYYADEFWQGGEKGYCFQQGVPWMDRVREATRLPENLIWWKAHNFVEMSFELSAIERDPLLGQEILEAIKDRETVKRVCRMVQDYFDVDMHKMIEAYDMVEDIFALEEIDPYFLSQKQQRAFIRRHKQNGANVDLMAALLTEMHEFFEDKFDPFMGQVNLWIKNMLNSVL